MHSSHENSIHFIIDVGRENGKKGGREGGRVGGGSNNFIVSHSSAENQ